MINMMNGILCTIIQITLTAKSRLFMCCCIYSINDKFSNDIQNNFACSDALLDE